MLAGKEEYKASVQEKTNPSSVNSFSLQVAGAGGGSEGLPDSKYVFAQTTNLSYRKRDLAG